MTENDEALQQARHDLEVAYLAAEEAWGSCDGQHAKPQAVQLRDRIVLGTYYVKHNPDPRLKLHLLHLKEEYSKAVADSKDQERCATWWAAYAEFVAAERRYKEAVANGG